MHINVWQCCKEIIQTNKPRLQCNKRNNASLVKLELTLISILQILSARFMEYTQITKKFIV